MRTLVRPARVVSGNMGLRLPLRETLLVVTALVDGVWLFSTVEACRVSGIPTVCCLVVILVTRSPPVRMLSLPAVVPEVPWSSTPGVDSITRPRWLLVLTILQWVCQSPY
uniref:Uncharacterized protein n=1 Tax=Cacopsylla melanoneura TaxID=428564 RepID=A0A8D8V583_9HEMI